MAPPRSPSALWGEGGQGEVGAARVPVNLCGRIERQHRLHQGLALRPRHQRGTVDREVEAPELAPAGEVGDRLARRAAPDERRQLPGLVLAERQAVFGQQGFGA